MKKVGTITFWWSKENYGQILQCFALLRFLRNSGYDAFLIKLYNNPKNHSYLRKAKTLLKYLLHPKQLKHRINLRDENAVFKQNGRIQARTEKEFPRSFENFLEKNIPSTQNIYTTKTLFANPPDADAYICGSDQIWGSGLVPEYFLQFAKQGVKKIAYAPSLGGYIPSSNEKAKIKQYLSSFSWITLREKQGVEVLKSIGIADCEKVPDPTLLLTSEDYRKLYDNQNFFEIKRPYILLYLLGNPIDLEIRSIYDFAQQHGLEVKYVASQGREDSFEKIYPTIEHWLYLIDNADYVITNSFHGTVFCLQYHKKFLTIPVCGPLSRMNGRVMDLLNEYSLTERLYTNDLGVILSSIDFSVFDTKRQAQIKYIYQKIKEII